MRFPPAWYPDPTGRHDHRWWDGAEWTSHVADAGVAGTDPLPATASAGPSASDGGAATAPRAAQSTPGVAVAALVVGLVAALIGWVPFLGIAVAVGALVLGVVAVRRTRGRSGRGAATTGLVGAALGLLAGIATTAVAVLLLADGAGGTFGRAMRDHVDCLEQRPAEVCERLLTERLLDLLGG